MSITLGSKVVQDLTYTCRQLGSDITVNYINSDSLSVSVSGAVINVNIVSGVTTATQIKTTLDADLDVMYLVSVIVSGTGSNAQVTCKNALIANGVTTAVKASLTLGTLKYTAQTAGTAGNSIRIKYTSGSLLVSVATNDITIRFVNGVTTASAIKAAIAASGAANALVAVVSSGAALTVPQYNAAALAFTNLAGGLDATPGSVVVQDLTFSTDSNTAIYNGKTVTFTIGATAGAEVVTVVDGNINVQIENGVSTATQIKTALDASADFNGVKSTGSIVVSNYAQLHLTKAAGTVTFGTPDNPVKAVGTATITDYSIMKRNPAVGSIKVNGYAGLTGDTVTAGAWTVTEGVDFDAETSNTVTASNIYDALVAVMNEANPEIDGIDDTKINITEIGDGSYGGNSIVLATSDAVNITLSGSTLSGGRDNALYYIAGHALEAQINFTPETSNDVTATNLAAAINALTEVNATSSTSTVNIVAATAGIAGNSITTSLYSSLIYHSYGSTIGQANLSGGIDASTVTVDGNIFSKVVSGPGVGEFAVIADLTTLINNLSSVDATDNGTVVAVVAHTAGTAGNSLVMSKTGAGLTLVQLSGGINASTVTVAGHVLTESSDYNATVSNDSTATSIASAVNALTEVNSTASTSTVNVVAAVPGIAGNSITLATSDAVNLLKSGAVLTGGSNKYECTITGTGSNAQKTVNGIQTTGAVGQGANALYHDQSTDALTSSYVYVNFHFHANNLTLINDETSGNKTIAVSWDGVNLHGSLIAGQSLGWNLQTTVTGIWLKYVNAAPAYRLYVLGS